MPAQVLEYLFRVQCTPELIFYIFMLEISLSFTVPYKIVLDIYRLLSSVGLWQLSSFEDIWIDFPIWNISTHSDQTLEFRVLICLNQILATFFVPSARKLHNGTHRPWYIAMQKTFRHLKVLRWVYHKPHKFCWEYRPGSSLLVLSRCPVRKILADGTFILWWKYRLSPWYS